MGSHTFPQSLARSGSGLRRVVVAGLVALAATGGVDRRPAYAADAGEGSGAAAGYLKTVRGDVRVITGGQALVARPGTAVQVGSVIRTGPDASVGLALKDNTLIALGPGSELSLDEYSYAPATGSLALVASIRRGTMEFVSGMIVRLRPQSAAIRTPTSTIGVRGTRFLVRVDE